MLVFTGKHVSEFFGAELMRLWMGNPIPGEEKNYMFIRKQN